MKKLLLLTGIFAVMSMQSLKTQVTVGNLEEPVSGALLQLKTISDATSDGDVNATKGLAIPRVALVKKDELQPMYPASEAANLSAETKKAHKGLVVYNVKEVDSENLATGLNLWDGEKWTSVSETQSKAEATINCNKVNLDGQYSVKAPLTSDNHIMLPVTVTKRGDYSILATTTNGYYFQAAGIFDMPGDYQIRLNGMGTPAKEGVDPVSFTNNGIPIEPVCDLSVTVGIANLTYSTVNCDNIKVYGEYWTRHDMNATNYVEIPIEVLTTGTTQWETNLVNGIKFVANQVLNATTNTLVVKAQGIPDTSGKFTYSFSTDGGIRNQCSFDIVFLSMLGSFSDPACKCLDIHNERPDAPNGEYFLQDCLDASATTPVKTYCDLVNGGYTLVWSFSERTAFNTYTPANSMSIEADYRFANDRPRNRVTTETGTINYSDYRLTRTEFQHFPNSTSRPSLKVRICENPTDMNDEWGLNNYGIIMPRSTSENPVESTFGPLQVPSVGKVWGKTWEEKASGGGAYGGWCEIGGDRLIALYSNAAYPTHWDWGVQGSTSLFQVIPNKGGSNNEMWMIANNNMFGWFGETQPNHHFGKCGGTSAGDYDFTIKTCGSGAGATELRPHSFNNGEGRYLQWFVR